MMKKICSLIPVLLVMAVLFGSCEKELSFENGGVPPAGGGTGGGGSTGGTAKYSIGDGTTDCSLTAIPQGTFKAGTALSAANTLLLTVDVDSIGSYSIATTSSNGFSFTGTGSFSDTGLQTITLVAAGTPVAAGTSSFNFGTGTCSFSVIVLAASTGGGGGGGGGATDYITCKIDGADKTFNLGATAVDIFGTILINGSESSSATTGNFTITLTNLLTMSVTPGTYTNNALGNTCMIAYIPNASDSAAWGSATAGQSQVFSVVVTNNSATRVEGTFSGTLYDNSGEGNNTKAVTNGAFSVPK